MQTGRSGSTRCGLTRSGHCLEVSGEIDESNADDLGSDLETGLTEGVTLVDLTAVTFFGAAGIRTLLRLGPVATRLGLVVRVRCSAQVRQVLDVCAITTVAGLVLEPPSTRFPDGETTP